MPAAAHPTAGQKRVARRPKCQSLGGAVRDVKRYATAKAMISITSVPTIVTTGVGIPRLRARGDEEDRLRDQGRDEERPEPRERVPGGPARHGVDALGQLRQVGRRVVDGGLHPQVRVGRGARGATGSPRRPPADRRRARPAPAGCRPPALPPRPSPASRPRASASEASAPASSSARRKGSGSGFAAPTTAEATTPSTSSSTPAGPSKSGSEQSQLLATTSRSPRLAQLAQGGRHVGERAELERSEHRPPRRARGRGPAAPAPRSSRRRSGRAGRRAIPVARPPCGAPR